MVLAYHLVICAYGFRLPNDPAGSASAFVGSDNLAGFGRSTRDDNPFAAFSLGHHERLRGQAKATLKYRPVVLNGLQTRAVARGFAVAVSKLKLSVWACSILPEHVHVVIGRSERPIEAIASHLKSLATRQLVTEGRHPLAECQRADGRTPQPWPFVARFSADAIPYRALRRRPQAPPRLATYNRDRLERSRQ